MKIHPFANLFPICSEDMLKELADDIKRNGHQHPIVVDRDGMLLDGRNRLLACEVAGITPMSTVFDGNEDDKLVYVASANMHRRHLTTSQKSMVCAKLIGAEKELEKGRKFGNATSVVENLPPQKTGKTRDVVGEVLGVSGKTVDMAVKVQTDAVPEIVAAVESGDLAVSAAALVAALPHDQQRQIVADGGANGVKLAAAKERKRIAKRKPRKSHRAKLSPESKEGSNLLSLAMEDYVNAVISLVKQNTATNSDGCESRADKCSLEEFCQLLFEKLPYELAEHFCESFMERLGWRREKKPLQ